MQSTSDINLTLDRNKISHEPLPTTLVVQNTTATISLKLDPNVKGGKLNLAELALTCRNTEYNPKRFSACIMRLRGSDMFPNMRTTGLIFGNGKIVITGSKSEAQGFYSAKQFAKIIRKLGYRFLNEDSLRSDFKVHNVVATVSLNHLIRLDGLATDTDHKLFVSYEPEIFAGLIYRMAIPDAQYRVVLLIFVTGKIVLTGAKSIKDCETALERMIPFIDPYKTISGTEDKIVLKKALSRRS
jgi:transcription initiation factor TFIID TATA-box-binding protein